MNGLLILLAAGLLLVWVSAVVYVAWMLAHPPRRTYASAVARSRAGDPSELVPARKFDSWAFRSRGVEFPVWDIQGDDPTGPVVILTHGWADSRIGGLLRVATIAPLASRIILWDLPGHGEARGVCRLGTAEVEDLEALVGAVEGRDEETKRRRDEGNRTNPTRERGNGALVVLHGWSLGAGVSIVVAGETRGIAGVIAESPYRVPATPARNVLKARGLPHRGVLEPALWLVGLLLGVGPRFERTARVSKRRSTETPGSSPLADARGSSGREATGSLRVFDRAAHAARLGCPLLVIHGTEDEVCPVEDGRAIAAAAPAGLGRLAEVEGARHNDLWTEARNTEHCTGAVQQFLAELEAG